MNEKCPVCQTHLDSNPSNIGYSDDVEYSCPRCGRFRIDSALSDDLPSLLSMHKDSIARISYALRRSQESNRFAVLRNSTFQKMLDTPLPRPYEQADLFIRWIAMNSPGPGEDMEMSSKNHCGIIGARNEAGFKLIADHLKEAGLIKATWVIPPPGNVNDCWAKLTFNGWERYEQLRSGSVIYRKAFMAMQYGDSILDPICENTFKPSTKRAGFDLIRQDQTRRAGLIDNRMRVEIQGADFVIADLTHRNPGAYWEAGYAEGLGKPVIFTCEKTVFDDKKTHFDTNHHLTIVWDKDAPGLAGEELTATIRATLPHIATMSD